MKKLFTILSIFFTAILSQAQSTFINKPLKDFSDVYDLSTPLNAGVTIFYFAVNGTDNLWNKASAFMIAPHLKDTTSNRFVDSIDKERMLNDTIKEIIFTRILSHV